jgi:hypothetical protein
MPTLTGEVVEMLTLDVAYVFDAVGGPTALLDLLRRNEPTEALSYAQVQMWRQRKTVSSAWVVPVIHVMTQQGFALGELLVDEGDPFGVVANPPWRVSGVAAV